MPPTVDHSSGEGEEEEVEVEEDEEEEETGEVLPTVDRDEDSTGEIGAGEAVRERRSGGEIERNGSLRIKTRKEQKCVPKDRREGVSAV